MIGKSILKSSFVFSVLLVIVVYFGINKWVLSFDHDAFFFAIKSWNLIQVKPSLYILLVASIFILIIPKAKSFIEVDIAIPIFVRRGISLFVILIAWFYTLYDFNFYANQWHLFDRFLVLLTAVLAIRHPVFTLVFVAQVYLVDFQFNFPLGGSKLLDKAILLELLKIWSAFHILLVANKFFKKRKLVPDIQVFYLLALTFYGFFYFVPGLQKIILSGGFGWPFENEISYNLLAIRNKGWLNTMPTWLIELHYDYFKNFGTIGQLGVLLTELFALFVLVKRSWLKVFIVLILVFHFHVFILNGALFWLWIIAGIFIYKMSNYVDKKLFSPKLILFSLFFLLVASFGVKTSNLGWYDSPLDNYFEVEVRTKSGETKLISLVNFEPYTLHLQYGNFLSAVDYKNIYPGFLILDKQVYEEVLETEVENTKELINAKGKNTFRFEMEKNLFRFFDAYVHNKSPSPSSSKVLSYLQPPKYWNAHLTDGLARIEKDEIKSITLYHCCVRRFIDQSEKKIWRRNVCHIVKGDRYKY